MEITRQEAIDCFASDDLVGIGMEADAVRGSLHPENIVTYAAARTIDLDRPQEDLFAQLEECSRAGDTTICLTPAPSSALLEIERTMAAIRLQFTVFKIQALSTRGVLALAQASRIPVAEVLARLRSAGLDAISGDDLGLSPEPIASLVPLDAWLELHRLAHHAGISSTSGLVFGLGETPEDRVHHLFAIRALQAETNGFTAFNLVTAPPRTHSESPTAVEYLRTLAIARIVLHDVSSIESSCVARGLKVTQMALRFGANDAGSLGTSSTAFTEEDLRRVIRDAGFIPVERDPLYRTLYLNN